MNLHLATPLPDAKRVWTVSMSDDDVKQFVATTAAHIAKRSGVPRLAIVFTLANAAKREELLKVLLEPDSNVHCKMFALFVSEIVRNNIQLNSSADISSSITEVLKELLTMLKKMEKGGEHEND